MGLRAIAAVSRSHVAPFAWSPLVFPLVVLAVIAADRLSFHKSVCLFEKCAAVLRPSDRVVSLTLRFGKLNQVRRDGPVKDPPFRALGIKIRTGKL
jgi:hypothetical protein